MDAAMAVLRDPEASNMARNAALKAMEIVQEYLRHSGDALMAAAKHSAPIAGLMKAHEQEERKKLSNAKATINASMKKKKKNQLKKLPEVMLLDDYVKQKLGDASPLAQVHAVSPKEKRITRSSTSTFIKSTTSIYDKSKLPEPQNGTSYTKPEIISVIENALQDESQGRAPSQRQVITA
jgi:Tol biopolymer transport system component